MTAIWLNVGGWNLSRETLIAITNRRAIPAATLTAPAKWLRVVGVRSPELG